MDGVDELVSEAKERFTKTLDHYSGEYDRGEEDVRFALGNQWEQAELNRRKQDKRPALTENRCMPFIKQVVNAAREMRPAIKVAPVDDKGDAETAEVFKGLVRNIERQSKASIAYDMAVQNSVMSGYGWIRINTGYSDPMSFNQEIRIESVADWRSVMIDPDSEAVDGSDAEYGFIYKDIPEEVFKEEYPDHEPSDFEGQSCDGEKVRIVEYFYKKYDEQTIYECFLADGTVTVLTKTQKDEIEKEGFFVKVLQERKTRIPTVKWCKLYGGGKLDETEWLGQYIPLVPVYGDLIWDENRLKSYSWITNAKDPQRMLNYVKTTITEIVGGQPKNQPWVGAVGSFNTSDKWEDANSENYAYLEYDMVIEHDEVTGQPVPAPPPQKSQPLQVSPALFQIEANASMGINAALGMFDENRGDESNAISGVAIKSRQIRGDKASYHYIDNLASSICHVGIIIIDLIPKIYNKPQVLRIIGKDDVEKTIQSDPNGQTNAKEGIYNLHASKYDVDIDVGSSYATQQQEFLDISKTLLQADPRYAEVAADKIVEAVGGVHADIIAERIRALNPMLLADDPMAEALKAMDAKLKQSEDEKLTLHAQLENKQKDMQAELALKQEEIQIKKVEANTDRMEALAKIEEIKMKMQGAESTALAEISQAIMDMDVQSTDSQNALALVIEKVAQLEGAIAGQAQATTPPV